MYWPDTQTGVDVEPARKPVASAVRKFFTEGGLGQAPTVPGGDWFNQITNELLNVLAAAGIDPSKADDDQLLQSIQWLASEAESTLRQDLASGDGPANIGFSQPSTSSAITDLLSRSRLSVYAEDFGALGNGSIDVNPIQYAIDFVYAAGGGEVFLGPKTYKLAASSLNETYDNFGVPVAASTGCLILRKGVSLVGVHGRTRLVANDPNKTLIYLVANDSQCLSGFELYNSWSTGQGGAGHGILQVGTEGGLDVSCSNTVFENLFIHNVASYAIGIQNGNPVNTHFNRIRVDMTGADGLDLKARGDATIAPLANSVSHIHVTRHGQRVDGSAGVDMRGIWHAKDITVSEMGGNAAITHVGIRFRTKPPASDPYLLAAAKSTLNGFTIKAAPGSPSLAMYGLQCGSDDVHMSQGTIENMSEGVDIVGNQNGAPTNCSLSAVTTKNCTIYGFRVLTGSLNTKLNNCHDTGSAIGFRNEGTNTTHIGCSGTFSNASSSVASNMNIGCRFGTTWVNVQGVNATSVEVSAGGDATDIILRLVPKGSSPTLNYGDFRPGVTNQNYLGSASLAWAGGFIQTAFTITSDERSKTVPLSITDVILDAWSEVDWVQFQLLDRVEAKGADGARWHFGVVAQRAIEAFARHGLDATRFAFLCYDEWDAVPAVYDDDGNVIYEAVEAGDRYGIRYEEALALEAALQRRNYQRLLTRIESLEAYHTA